jgi:hypothetical protein
MGNYFSDTVGPYWSQSNKNFEYTNPSMVDRVVRAINPLTGFGSALGQWSDAANKGNPMDMGLAAATAFPVTAATRLMQIPGKGLIKSFEKLTSNIPKTATKLVGGATVNSGVDSAQASNPDSTLALSIVRDSQGIPKRTQQQQMLLDQLALPKQALARGESPDYSIGTWAEHPDPSNVASIWKNPSDAHFTDVGKLPNHFTFSNESAYNSKATPGGSWTQDKPDSTLVLPNTEGLASTLNKGLK